MVKTKGPMQSVAASGTIANILTFGKFGKTTMVRKKPRSKPTRTGLQISMRAMMSYLSSEWTSWLPSEKATWAAVYPDEKINNYNAMIRVNMMRWREHLAPTRSYPANLTEAADPLMVATATGGVRHVKIDLELLFGFTYAQGVLIFHDTTATPASDVDKLIKSIVLRTPAPIAWTHTPLGIGTHYYRFTPFARKGGIDWLQTYTDSAIVT